MALLLLLLTGTPPDPLPADTSRFSVSINWSNIPMHFFKYFIQKHLNIYKRNITVYLYIYSKF